MAETLKIGYDREADILEIFFCDPTATISDEVDEGIFVARATDDDRVVSVMVVNLSRRFKGLELLDVPLELPVAAA